mmetsp:Transcript_26454/g.57717  ORF Transcript_26454/g.57717 Transcript_26454/m.57717 type:complete len:91 (-) Transcript_26454:906-1178(-)
MRGAAHIQQQAGCMHCSSIILVREARMSQQRFTAGIKCKGWSFKEHFNHSNHDSRTKRAHEGLHEPSKKESRSSCDRFLGHSYGTQHMLS